MLGKFIVFIVMFLFTMWISMLNSTTLYFSNNYVDIIATKNLDNFPENLNSIKKVIPKIEAITLKIFNQHDRMSSENNAFNTVKKALSDLTLNSLENCKSKISKMTNKAADIFAQALDSHHRTRKKRGIRFLGDILHDITDLPSPSEWSQARQQEIMLKKAVEDENLEIAKIENILENNSKFTEKLLPQINNLTLEFFLEQKESQALQYLISLIVDYDKINVFCSGNFEIAEQLIDEANIILSIKNSADLNKPSPYMFPKEFLQKEIDNYNFNNHKNILDLFSHETTDIYSLENCITIIHQNTIHSITSIPLIDFTYSYNLIMYPNINKNDTIIINNLEQIAHKKLDVFGCSLEHQYIILNSNRDLTNCLKHKKATKTTLICHNRQIQSSSPEHFPCENFAIGDKSLAIELNPTTVLLRTLLKSVTIHCDNYTKILLIDEEYSKISINENCMIIGKDIKIGKYNNDKFQSINTSIAKLNSHIQNIQGEIIPLKTDLSNFSSKISNVIGNIHKNLSNLKELREKTKLDIKELSENDNIMTEKSSFIIPTTIIATIILIITLFFTYKLCQKKCKPKYNIESAELQNKIDDLEKKLINLIRQTKNDQSNFFKSENIQEPSCHPNDTIFPKELNPLNRE